MQDIPCSKIYRPAFIGSDHGAEGDGAVRIVIEEIMLAAVFEPPGDHRTVGSQLVGARAEVEPLAADEPPASGHSAGGGQIVPAAVDEAPDFGGHEAVRVKIIPGSPVKEPAGRVFAIFVAVSPFSVLLIPSSFLGLCGFCSVLKFKGPGFHKGNWEIVFLGPGEALRGEVPEAFIAPTFRTRN